eukprot:PhM_4_TR10454/c2_g1_i1/m.21284/K12195/CHMP6, VPS20; charged multivesicular body protein 6
MGSHNSKTVSNNNNNNNNAKKKSAIIITSHDRAVLELKLQRDKVYAAQKRAAQCISKETEAAKELLRQGLRDRAALCLQRKRLQEQHMLRLSQVSMNVDKMIASTEFAKIEKEVFDAVRMGTVELEKLNKQLDIDIIDRLMGEAAEALDAQREITDALAEQLDSTDIEACEAELEQLISVATKTTQRTKQQQQQQPKPTVLPSVPTSQIGKDVQYQTPDEEKHKQAELA